MSRLDSLSPDLRAALSLLLRQQKRHADVAAMLGMSERAVHDRAHAALGLLAPAQARALSPEHRKQVGEYLLRQQTEDQQRATRAYLERDPDARAWAQAVELELRPLASKPLPAIPAIPSPAGGEREPQLASSRTGGALLLGAIAAAIVVVVLLVVGVGGGGGSKGHSTTTTRAPSTADGKTSTGAANSTSPANSGSDTSTTSTTSNTSSGTHATRGKALPLTSPHPTTSKAVGLAYVFTQNSRHAFYLLAKELPALPSGTFYAVWLEDAPSAPDYPLGSLPAAGTDGLVEGGGPLPSSAGEYKRIVVTTETSHTPTAPGPTVLRGAFMLH